MQHERAHQEPQSLRDRDLFETFTGLGYYDEYYDICDDGRFESKNADPDFDMFSDRDRWHEVDDADFEPFDPVRYDSSLDSFEQFPFTESLRMGARRRVGFSSLACRWNRRPYERHMRKRSHCGYGVHAILDGESFEKFVRRNVKWARNKPRVCRFDKDWHKSA